MPDPSTPFRGRPGVGGPGLRMRLVRAGTRVLGRRGKATPKTYRLPVDPEAAPGVGFVDGPAVVEESEEA